MPLSSLAGLSLRDLEYAVAVADLLHFGRAAERCGVSQAGLSEQVRKLEGLLGLALFERSSRRIAVTPEGEPLLRQARAVLDAARALLEAAQRRAGGPLDGPLRLGAIATLGPYYLPGLLREVRAAFPRLELRLEEGRTAALLAALQDGALDAVLLALPAGAEGVSTVPLFFEPFLAALPTGHALEERPVLAVGDLAGEGLLLLEEGHCLRDQALALCGATGPGAGSRLASSLEMLRHMVAAGEGFTLLPLLATRERAELDGLVRHRELEDGAVGRTIGLAWRASDPRGGAFRRVARFLRGTAPAGTRPLMEEGPSGEASSAPGTRQQV